MEDRIIVGDVQHKRFSADVPFSDSVFAPNETWKKKELELFGVNLTEELIQEFRKAVKTKGIFLSDTKNVCAMFLRAGGLDVENSLKLLKTYLRNKENCAHYFVKDGIPHVRSVLSMKLHSVTPYRDKEGRRVLILRPGRWETDKISLSDLYCVSAMLCELVATEPLTQISGVLIIFDGEGFGYSQLKSIGIQDAKNIADFMNCFPLWFRGIHLIRQPFVFNMAYNLVYPFLNENAKKALHCHGRNMNSLHQFVDPGILPADYGGSLGEFDNDEVSETFCSLEKYYASLKSWHQ